MSVIYWYIYNSVESMSCDICFVMEILFLKYKITRFILVLW